jgi:ethylene-insensitive protein 3
MTSTSSSDYQPTSTSKVKQPQLTIIQSDVRPSELAMPSSPIRSDLSPEELKTKIDEYSTKISEYTRNRENKDKGKQKVPIYKPQKKISSYHEGRVLDEMMQIEQCPIKGYLYGMVDKDGKTVTGASDSLRAWWKGQAMFDKVALSQIDLCLKENSLSSNVAKDNEGRSTIELLMELSDPTLGSILTLLAQHCNPPQRNFPYEKLVPPPWWPTSQEGWWGQTGISAEEGPPPFKKPHDLRKKWKAAVIIGIIKLMSPEFSKLYSLVEQSQHLSSRMNAKERKFWTLALVAEAMLYCQEVPGVPADHAVAFLLAYGNEAP